MIEFFQNIGNWFVENREGLMALVTSSNFMALCGLIFTLLQNSNRAKKNTNSMNAINQTLTVQNAIEQDVGQAKEVVINTNEKVADLETRLCSLENALKDFDSELMNKVDSMLEVFTIVYSTIKDDAIRNSVNSILVTAKHSSAATKAKLEEELANLKAEFAKNVDTVKEHAEEALTKVGNVINGRQTEQPEISNVTRY